jgi:shikimate kinase
MPKVLVTGMSGTGKSAALQALGERGHRVVDTDTGQWSRWETSPDGAPDWIWREDAIMALLSAPADVLLARIAARTSNPYGKHPDERAQILRDLAEVEPLLRATATIEIDATAPLSQVVRHLENLT